MQTSEHNIFALRVYIYIHTCVRRKSVDVFADSVSSKSKRNETSTGSSSKRVYYI